MKDTVLNGLALFICFTFIAGFLGCLVAAMGLINTLIFAAVITLGSWAAFRLILMLVGYDG